MDFRRNSQRNSQEKSLGNSRRNLKRVIPGGTLRETSKVTLRGIHNGIRSEIPRVNPKGICQGSPRECSGATPGIPGVTYLGIPTKTPQKIACVTPNGIPGGTLREIIEKSSRNLRWNFQRTLRRDSQKNSTQLLKNPKDLLEKFPLFCRFSNTIPSGIPRILPAELLVESPEIFQNLEELSEELLNSFRFREGNLKIYLKILVSLDVNNVKQV